MRPAHPVPTSETVYLRVSSKVVQDVGNDSGVAAAFWPHLPQFAVLSTQPSLSQVSFQIHIASVCTLKVCHLSLKEPVPTRSSPLLMHPTRIINTLPYTKKNCPFNSLLPVQVDPNFFVYMTARGYEGHRSSTHTEKYIPVLLS